MATGHLKILYDTENLSQNHIFLYRKFGLGNSSKKMVPWWETSSSFSGLLYMTWGLPKKNSGDKVDISCKNLFPQERMHEEIQQQHQIEHKNLVNSLCLPHLSILIGFSYLIQLKSRSQDEPDFC